jgi:hypothetical protein
LGPASFRIVGPTIPHDGFASSAWARTPSAPSCRNHVGDRDEHQLGLAEGGGAAVRSCPEAEVSPWLDDVHTARELAKRCRGRAVTGVVDDDDVAHRSSEDRVDGADEMRSRGESTMTQPTVGRRCVAGLTGSV